MPATFPIPLITVIPGQLITATLWMNEYTNIYNGFTPSGLDDYSLNDAEMQTQTDPFPSGVISRPTSLAGELERIRFIITNITGGTYWYDQSFPHDLTQIWAAIVAIQGRFPVQTVDIGNSQVTEAKLSTSVAGNGLDGGAGTPLSVNVDATTIEINGDTLRVKDLGISTAKIAALAVTDAKINDVATSKLTGTISTSQIGDAQVTFAKLASDIVSKLSPKSIQRSSATLQWSTESQGTKTANVTITSVDSTKSVVIYNGATSSASGGGSGQGTIVDAKAQLTSDTNVEVQAAAFNGSSSGTITVTVVVYFTVLEFN